MNNWKKVKLNEVCDLIPGYAFKGSLFGNFKTKVIKIADIKPPYVDSDLLKGVDVSSFNKNKLQKFVAKTGDFVLAMTGATIGKIGKVFGGPAYVNQRVLLFKHKDNIDEKFLYYYLLQNGFQQYIYTHIDSQSAQANIGSETIGNYDLKIPLDKVYQSAIANVLSSFDDKIELNNKMIKNLEEQAQALYKHWFVDFEFPNQEGKPYKSSGGSFKDSELGKIPTDWEICLLKKYLNFQKGFEPGNKLYQAKKSNHSIEFFRVGELLETAKIFVEKDLIPAECIANIYDVLVSFDGTVGRVAVGKIGAFSGGIRKVFSNIQSINNAMIYFLFQSEYIQKEIKKYESSRTTITHASGAINDFLIAYKENVYSRYSICINALYQQLITLKQQNQKLAEMRNYLLPKLMSGEIKVSTEIK